MPFKWIAFNKFIGFVFYRLKIWPGTWFQNHTHTHTHTLINWCWISEVVKRAHNECAWCLCMGLCVWKARLNKYLIHKFSEPIFKMRYLKRICTHIYSVSTDCDVHAQHTLVHEYCGRMDWEREREKEIEVKMLSTFLTECQNLIL